MKRALLLSGGIDSTALGWWVRPEIAYTVDYGQAPAESEIRSSQKLCEEIGCPHVVLQIDASELGSGLMAKSASSRLSRNPEWWPFRNQFLATVVGMHAVRSGISELVAGSVKSDSRHRDGRPAFIRNLNRLMIQQEGALKFRAPAISLTSLALIGKAMVPARVLLNTHSCHTGNSHCCVCPGCTKRLQILRKLKLTDN